MSAWPWLPRPGSGRGLVLCLDRKTNEFHYGIAILFHVSGSLRLTCSPGCDKPRHPRARARALGLCMLAGTELSETPPHLLQTHRAAGLCPSSLPLGTWGGSVCPRDPLATQGFRSGARWGAQHPTCTCLYARMPVCLQKSGGEQAGERKGELKWFVGQSEASCQSWGCANLISIQSALGEQAGAMCMGLCRAMRHHATHHCAVP